jgi:hypothetical protein
VKNGVGRKREGEEVAEEQCTDYLLPFFKKLPLRSMFEVAFLSNLFIYLSQASNHYCLNGYFSKYY